uniref:histidine-tRNA synthetase n=1 Tax=Tsunamia transpacifica TaxID=1935457 RepID=UPI001BED8CB6|nr:histidine-tRNA synthetase [Tsunamia transpacifica]QUE27952.1 syh [Tsunamia transpacifica]UNJ14467.1 histidine-tRNA synthetase [Tsunamia transpacifica]
MSHIQGVRGTKDILSSDINLWRTVEIISREILESAHYKEIRTPIFEQSKLFTMSLGQVTDIVQKEMYTFQDRSKRELTLRPEGTAGIARAFIEHKLYSQANPQRFWYHGPMFRYERPQAGRQRQFHQLGLECIGSSDALVEAEVISLAVEILQELKIPKLTLHINSLGNNVTRETFKKALYQYFVPYKSRLDEESQIRLENNPLRLLDSKEPQIRSFLNDAPVILDFLDEKSRLHFDKVCHYLDALSIKYIIDPYLVRGLDYYNNTTFEIKSLDLGAQDTICGGGRYDNLVKSLGGPSIPAIGWAIGMERLLLSVPTGIIPISLSLDCYLISLGIEAKQYSLILFQQLRKQKLKIEMDLSENSLPKQLKKASQMYAKTCIIIGDEEIQKKNIILKNLSTSVQEILPINDFTNIANKIKSQKVGGK